MADPGTVAAFARLMAATRDLPLDGPEKVVNLAQQYRWYTCRRMLNGRNAKDYFQGGPAIITQLQLNIASQTRDYLPTDSFEAGTGKPLTSWTAPWRFCWTPKVWYDQEIELNSPSKAQLKDLAIQFRQEQFTDFWNYRETALWQLPKAEMEGGNASGKTWYSIPAIITRTGGAPTIADDGADADFSTIFGVSFAGGLNTGFKSNFGTYESISPETTLLEALDSMFLDLSWEKPDEDGKTGATDHDFKKTDLVTNKEGYLLLLKLAKEQNSMPNPQYDISYGMGKIIYNGITIRKSDAIPAAIAPVGKPPFYFIDYNSLRFFFHSGHYLKAKTFNGTATSPEANVEHRLTWGNVICTDRRAQGVVFGV